MELFTEFELLPELLEVESVFEEFELLPVLELFPVVELFPDVESELELFVVEVELFELLDELDDESDVFELVEEVALLESLEEELFDSFDVELEVVVEFEEFEESVDELDEESVVEPELDEVLLSPVVEAVVLGVETACSLWATVVVPAVSAAFAGLLDDVVEVPVLVPDAELVEFVEPEFP